MDNQNLSQDDAKRQWEAAELARKQLQAERDAAAGNASGTLSQDLAGGDQAPMTHVHQEAPQTAPEAPQTAQTVQQDPQPIQFPQDRVAAPQGTLTDAQAQAAATVHQFGAQTIQASQAAPNLAMTQIPAGAGILTREQAIAAQQERRNRGTQVWLENTGTVAIIRDLPFAEYTMLQGIPADLRGAIDASIRNEKTRNIMTGGTVKIEGLEDAVQMYEVGLQAANAICIAAFVTPRLVQTADELDPADPNVWLVTDIDAQDRLDVMTFINRDRSARVLEQGGAVASAGFPG